MIAITQREVKRDRKLDPTEFLGETEANPIKKKSEKEHIKAVYCHSASLTYMQSTS